MSARSQKQVQYMQKIKESLEGKPDYMESYFYYLTGKVPKTCALYIYRATKFCEWLDKPFEKITKDDINRFLGEIAYKENGEMASPSLRDAYWSAVKSFMEFLYDTERIPTNIIASMRRPQIRYRDMREKVCLDDSDIKKILKKLRKKAEYDDIGIRNYLIVLLFLETGMRLSALANIDVSDISRERQCITVVEKEGKVRDFYVSENIMEAIELWLPTRDLYAKPGDDALFISSNYKRRITEAGIEKIIKEITSEIKKTVAPHRLRAYFATKIYKETKDIVLVQRMLGHESLETTQRYISSYCVDERRGTDIMSKILYK